MSDDLLAVYGTLRRRDLFRKAPRVTPQLKFVGSGLIRGLLFWQRGFPGLKPGPGVVKVELFEVNEPSVWRELDPYEGFNPDNLSSSMFVRRRVRILRPGVLAWVYFLNPAIPIGCRLDRTENESGNRMKRLSWTIPKRTPSVRSVGS